MNTLFVSDVSICDIIGGAERVLFEQSTRLQKKGHNVHILTRKLPYHDSSSELIQGVQEWRYDIDQRNIVSFLRSTLANCKELFESIQNQYSFDCINFHQPFSALAVRRSAAARNIRKIYTCHSLSFEEFETRNPKPKGALGTILYFLNVKARKSIEKKVLNASDKIVVLSEFTKNKLLNSYGVGSEKIVLIPGGIDFKKFYPANDKIGIRNRLNIPSEKFVLLTVRNLVPRMGLEDLLFAVRQAVERVPDVYLVLGGEGPLKNSLTSLSRELQLQDHVKFVGFIPDMELPEYYRMADLFVLPTLELEGFGLVTLEALASGVPVLGTPVGGTVEILGKLDPKYLFRDTTPESMASLIVETCQQFKNNPGFWEEVSSKCRLFVEGNYSWDKNIACLEELFKIA